MKEFLETTLGKILLGITVITIWGINVVNFSGMANDDTIQSIQQIQNINLEELEIPEKKTFKYSSSSRDPFIFGTIVKAPEIRSEPDVQQENYIEPQLQLTGIFDGMAVISDERGQTYFLKKGEVFKDHIEVEWIAADSVVLEYKKRIFTLKMN